MASSFPFLKFLYLVVVFYGLLERGSEYSVCFWFVISMIILYFQMSDLNMFINLPGDCFFSHLVWDYHICLILNENKDNSVHSGKKDCCMSSDELNPDVSGDC